MQVEIHRTWSDSFKDQATAQVNIEMIELVDLRIVQLKANQSVEQAQVEARKNAKKAQVAAQDEATQVVR